MTLTYCSRSLCGRDKVESLDAIKNEVLSDDDADDNLYVLTVVPVSREEMEKAQTLWKSGKRMAPGEANSRVVPLIKDKQ